MRSRRLRCPLFYSALTVLTVGASCFRESDVVPEDSSSSATGESGADVWPGSISDSLTTAGSDPGTGEDDATDTSDTGNGPCTLDSQCDDGDPCTLDVCDELLCQHLALDEVPVVEQTMGDCRVIMCIAGEPEPRPDATDVPDDHEDCTIDACEEGEPVHAPASLGEPCSKSGTCDGMGACLECLSPDDCDHLPVDDDCAMRTCDGGTCGQTFAPAGTLVNPTLQTPGDCQQVVCDGEGGMTSEPNNTDPYLDGYECTQDYCSDGEPQNPPRPAGTPCAAGECNAIGQCTGCNEPEDCGEASDCQAPTCSNGGVCGVENASEGTPLPFGEQTDGDCQELRCDGNGASASYADNDDVPSNDGNACTDEVCNGGLPQHPDEPVGTPCGDGGGSYCDGMGECVECIDAGDCPAASQCHVAVCENNECGTEPADAGTPCSDGQFCTATDTCNAAGTCVGSVNPCTGADGDADCSESCDEAANACTGNDPPGSPCTDGLYCTQSDACDASGECVGTGDPCPGADGDSDCTESCDEASDACTADDPGGSACDDALVCTTGDTCNAGTCSGSAVVCDVEGQSCYESCLGCAEASCG